MKAGLWVVGSGVDGFGKGWDVVSEGLEGIGMRDWYGFGRVWHSVGGLDGFWNGSDVILEGLDGDGK